MTQKSIVKKVVYTPVPLYSIDFHDWLTSYRASMGLGSVQTKKATNLTDMKHAVCVTCIEVNTLNLRQGLLTHKNATSIGN